jgi:hypothetical protein
MHPCNPIILLLIFLMTTDLAVDEENGEIGSTVRVYGIVTRAAGQSSHRR